MPAALRTIQISGNDREHGDVECSVGAVLASHRLPVQRFPRPLFGRIGPDVAAVAVERSKPMSWAMCPTRWPSMKMCSIDDSSP